MMAALSEDRLQELLAPFIGQSSFPPNLNTQLSTYLDLLLMWNGRTNLTAIREPEEIVRRHFGESIFLGKHLPHAHTLLDYGSGAGFPGLPIQLLLPELKVTLAESQGKKASFLREAVRVLRLETEVWPHRVEAMDQARRFDVVTLRAVDEMEEATGAARSRITHCGIVALLVSGDKAGIPVPHSLNRVIRFIP